MRSGTIGGGRDRARRSGARTIFASPLLATVVAAATMLAATPVRAAPESGRYAEELARAQAAVNAGDDETALEAYRAAYASRPEGDEIARRDLLHEIGRAEARRHRETGDVAALRRAEASLADAEDACGDDAVVCAEIGSELAEVRHELGTDTAPAGDAAAPPSAVVAPRAQIQPTAAPAMPSDDAVDRNRRLKTADGVMITGAVFMGVAGVALVFLAMPAAIAAEIAEDRADDDAIFASESDLRGRAERRRRFARISAITGAGCLVFGGAMLGAGLGMRSKIRKETRATAMMLEGGGGVALVGRF